MIRAYMTERVNVIDYTYDEWGEIESTSIIPHRARIQYQVANILNFKGEETVSDKKVMMEDFAISPDAKIEIGNVRYPIQKISRPKDFSWQYLEVYL